MGSNAASYCQDAVGATPSSSGDYYQRNIGESLFAEWGYLYDNRASGFDGYNYWTSDSDGSNQFYVYVWGGRVESGWTSFSNYGGCVYP